MSSSNIEKVYVFELRSARDDSKFFDEDKVVVKKIVLKRSSEDKKQYLQHPEMQKLRNVITPEKTASKQILVPIMCNNKN